MLNEDDIHKQEGIGKIRVQIEREFERVLRHNRRLESEFIHNFIQIQLKGRIKQGIRDETLSSLDQLDAHITSFMDELRSKLEG